MRTRTVITASLLSIGLLAMPFLGQARAEEKNKTITWGKIFSIFRRPRSQPKGSRPAIDVCPILPASRQLSSGEQKSGEALDLKNTEIIIRSHPLLYWRGDVQHVTVRERDNQTELWRWDNSAEPVQQVLYGGEALEPGKAYELMFEGASTVIVPMMRATEEVQMQLEQKRDRLITHLNNFQLTPEQIARQEVVFWGERYRLYSEALTVFLEKAPQNIGLQQAFEDSQQDFCEQRFSDPKWLPYEPLRPSSGR